MFKYHILSIETLMLILIMKISIAMLRFSQVVFNCKCMLLLNNFWWSCTVYQMFGHIAQLIYVSAIINVIVNDWAEINRFITYGSLFLEIVNPLIQFTVFYSFFFFLKTGE
jgi:hypothetical protein